ncbi:MAG: hypothetical protein HY649_01675, partial [Acidobacteria bacterium]|nr:hypothetical protein [Acidobacteriota bacterium]
IHRLIEDEFFEIESFSSRSDFLAKATPYQLYCNLVRPNSHRGYSSPWQILQRLAPRSPLELCLLPPVTLDYFLKPQGGYTIHRSIPNNRLRAGFAGRLDNCKFQLQIAAESG